MSFLMHVVAHVSHYVVFYTTLPYLFKTRSSSDLFMDTKLLRRLATKIDDKFALRPSQSTKFFIDGSFNIPYPYDHWGVILNTHLPLPFGWTYWNPKFSEKENKYLRWLWARTIHKIINRQKSYCNPRLNSWGVHSVWSNSWGGDPGLTNGDNWVSNVADGWVNSVKVKCGSNPRLDSS